MATAASDPLVMFLDEIECSICLEVCQNRAKLSSNFSHTFCKKCIDGINHAHNNGEEIVCPSCRTFTETSDYQKNSVVNHYSWMFKHRQDQSEECWVCHWCNSKYICIVCDIFLCEGCKAKHDKDQLFGCSMSVCQ